VYKVEGIAMSHQVAVPRWPKLRILCFKGTMPCLNASHALIIS
jgi:hypothetical protein